MCMIEDSEGWEFVTTTNPRARKEHRCDECRRTIAVGETYMHTTGKCDGSISTYKTCRHCEAASTWLVVACSGWIYSMVLYELREHWEESEGYRTPMLARLIAGMRRGWNGGAMDVPDVDLVRASVPSYA